MRAILRAVYLSHALLLIAALCHVAAAQDSVSLSERVANAIEHEEPAWKVVIPLAGSLHAQPSIAGAWDAGRYRILVALSAYPSSREAAEALKRQRISVTAMQPSSLTTARSEFRKANVLVTVGVGLSCDARPLAAPAQSSSRVLNASSLAERVTQIISALIAAEVRVDACVNELYPNERAAAAAPRESFFRDVESGCLPRVEQALRSGADANGRDDRGTPVLTRAVAAGRRDVAQLLLRAGAAPDARDGAGGTAVLRILSRPSAYRAEDLPSILTSQLAILDDLLAAGANLEASDQTGRTLLLEVARMNYDDGSPGVLLKALIERGADISARDREGRTAVMLAVLNTHPKVSLQTLQVLLAAGSEVNALDKSGKTALWYALERADRDGGQEWGRCLSFLTSAGATAVVQGDTGAVNSPK